VKHLRRKFAEKDFTLARLAARSPPVIVGMAMNSGDLTPSPFHKKEGVFEDGAGILRGA
jgi:hypothetical protein